MSTNPPKIKDHETTDINIVTDKTIEKLINLNEHPDGGLEYLQSVRDVYHDIYKRTGRSYTFSQILDQACEDLGIEEPYNPFED